MIILAFIRKNYPLIGVLKHVTLDLECYCVATFDQEELPAYWGIETIFFLAVRFLVVVFIRKNYPLIGVLKLHVERENFHRHRLNQEELPAYWGIETCKSIEAASGAISLSGRITRLLGY